MPARRPSIVLLFAGILGAHFPLHAAFRADTILSVLVTNDFVFASTRKGLFRADRSEKKWAAITLPDGMEPGGCFSSSSAPDTPKMYYSPPSRALSGNEWSCPLGRGLWSSGDWGKTWLRVDASDFFIGVFVHSDGILYSAATSSLPRAPELGLPMMISTDGGWNWSEAPGQEQLPRLILVGPACAANPAHVCGIGWSLQDYSMEYAPENGTWSKESEGEAYSKAAPAQYLAATESDLRMGFASRLIHRRANLENYFRYGFGERLSLPGIAVRTGATSYTFRQDKPKVIDASLELMPTDPPLADLSLPDVRGTQRCWALGYILPNGKHGFTNASCTSTDTNVVSATSHIVLTPGKPYSRRIDLGSIMNFDAPGLYHLHLVFDDSFMSAEDWTGRFAGGPFEVTIVP